MEIKIGKKSRILTEVEKKCLKNDLPGDEGIEEWCMAGPIEEKIHNTKTRMEGEWMPKLRERGLDIPANDEDLVNLITSQPDYKDRETRDKEK